MLETGVPMAAADAPISCAICGKPIFLEDASVDENGKPVHEECYLTKIRAEEKRDPTR